MSVRGVRVHPARSDDQHVFDQDELFIVMFPNAGACSERVL